MNSSLIGKLVFVLLCFRATEAVINVKPSDALVVEGGNVVFECSANSTGKITWRHTTVVSSQTIEFYSNGEIRRSSKYAFYKLGGFRVDVGLHEYANLIISNVTARHAGKYACSDGTLSGTHLADLTVIEKRYSCSYVNVEDLSETEITCNLTMTGNSKPKMICLDAWRRSTESVAERPRNSTDLYLSTTAKLSPTTDETLFSCSILLNERYPPILAMPVLVNHARVKTASIEITSTARANPETFATVKPSEDREDTSSIDDSVESDPEEPLFVTIGTSTIALIVIVLGLCLGFIRYYRNRTAAGEGTGGATVQYLTSRSSRV